MDYLKQLLLLFVSVSSLFLPSEINAEECSAVVWIVEADDTAYKGAKGLPFNVYVNAITLHPLRIPKAFLFDGDAKECWLGVTTKGNNAKYGDIYMTTRENPLRKGEDHGFKYRDCGYKLTLLSLKTEKALNGDDIDKCTVEFTRTN